MGSITSNTQYQNWPWWRAALIGLNILALIVSVILSWHFLKGGSMIGCNAGSSCDEVLNSKWSTIAGVVPVSSLAMGVYLAMFVAAFFIGPDAEPQIRGLSWKVLLILAGAIAGSAIWFVGVQKWLIDDFCPYCMTLHITGLLVSALIIWQGRKAIQKESSSRLSDTTTKIQKTSAVKNSRVFSLRLAGLILIGLFVSGILATGQMVFTPKSTYDSGASADQPADFDYSAAPIIGSSDAPYVVKVLFDYECSHCQQIHFMLDDVVKRYKGQLAFVLCPAPLNTKCNPYIPRDGFKNSCELARIGMKVWAAKREVYTEFENWMFTYESGDKWQPRSVEAAQAKAIELVGEKFNSAEYNDWVEQYIQSSLQVYGETIKTGKGGIPKLVYGSQWVIPEPDNEDDLITILQQSLSLPKP